MGIKGVDVRQATAMFIDLVRVETRLYNAVEARLQADHGLSLGQFQLLEVIDRVENCRVNDIVHEVAITVGAASKGVDRMEQARLCRREPNPGDRRSSILTLTEVGASQLKAARPTVEAELVALVAEVGGPAAVRSAAPVLSALRTSLERRDR